MNVKDLSEFALSPVTLTCAEVIPSRRCVSTRSVGWRSLLIDHHIGTRSPEPYRPISTPDVEIGVATSGSYASEVLRGKHWRRGAYQTGSICLPRNEPIHQLRFEPLEAIESSTAMLYLPHAQLAVAAEHVRAAGQRPIALQFHHPVDRDPAIFHVVTSLLRAMEQGADDLYAQTAAAWLSVHLVTRYLREGNVATEEIADSRLANVIEYMTVHFAQPLTLDQLAAEACVSKFHFARSFRAKVGVTPHAFLTHLRLEAAHRMLIESDLPVAEIGAACGYPRPSHFSAAFTKKYGLSPTASRSGGTATFR